MACVCGAEASRNRIAQCSLLEEHVFRQLPFPPTPFFDGWKVDEVGLSTVDGKRLFETLKVVPKQVRGEPVSARVGCRQHIQHFIRSTHRRPARHKVISNSERAVRKVESEHGSVMTVELTVSVETDGARALMAAASGAKKTVDADSVQQALLDAEAA